MAVVDTINIRDLGPRVAITGMGDVLGEVKDGILAQVKKQGWRWFNLNSEKVIFTKKVLWIRVSLKVRDVRFLFEELFDAEPVKP